MSHPNFLFHKESTYGKITRVNRPCDKMYSGVRCEHVILDTQQLSSPEEVIGISCGVVLLLGIIVGLMYCCLKKRCRKSSPPYKN
uniref:EGF-like domain-containing protein n=1 Tax=Sinocyclocheilus anshuiensis TaxID=1608454 RepID=A0A671MTR6_9TELE